MADNVEILDEYDAIEKSEEFQWEHPCYKKINFDTFSCTYTVEIRTLHPLAILKSRQLVEEQYCRYGIICSNLGMIDNPTSRYCLGELMEYRMLDNLSLVCIEVETKKVLGVVVAVERKSFKNVKPDEMDDSCVLNLFNPTDKDVQCLEELRCLVKNLAAEPLSEYLHEGETYLEIVLVWGSRDTTNHFEIETILIDKLIKITKMRKIKNIIVISDYRKHQQHFMSLGFIKVSEMPFASINSHLGQMIFSKTDASTSIICLLLKPTDRRTIRFILKSKPPPRRPTRLNFAI